MSKVTRHYRLPVASTESVRDPKFFQFGKTATLYFDYFIGNEARRSGIRFDGVIAVLTRSERFSSSWNVKAYDTLTEIHQSPWAVQIRQEISEMYRGELDKFRHFAIYLDSAGSFEVLCVGFEVLPEEIGSWESLSITTAS